MPVGVSNFQESVSPASRPSNVTIDCGTVVRKESEDFSALTNLDSKTGMDDLPTTQYAAKIKNYGLILGQNVDLKFKYYNNYIGQELGQKWWMSNMKCKSFSNRIMCDRTVISEVYATAQMEIFPGQCVFAVPNLPVRFKCEGQPYVVPFSCRLSNSDNIDQKKQERSFSDCKQNRAADQMFPMASIGG